MKTLVIIQAALMISFSSIAMTPSEFVDKDAKNLNLKNLVVPEIIEMEVEETHPFDTEEIFHEERLKDLQNNFDISTMVKPEQEVDDLPEGLLVKPIERDHK